MIHPMSTQPQSDGSGNVLLTPQSSGFLGQIYLATASTDASVKVWDPKNGNITHTIVPERPPTSLTSLKDGRLVVGTDSGVILIYKLFNLIPNASTQTNTSENEPPSSEWFPVYRLKGHILRVNSVIPLPGDRLASGSSDCSIRLWRIPADTETRLLKSSSQSYNSSSNETLSNYSPPPCAELESVRKYSGHADSVLCLIELNDGRICSGSRDQTIKIWHLTRAKCEMTLRGHVKAVTKLTVLSDGRLVSSSEDSSMTVWNVVKKCCDFTLEGHTASVNSVYKLKDGRLVSASSDLTLKVWQVLDSNNTETEEKTKILYTLKGHTDVVTAITELDDGRLVSCSSDSCVRIWNLTSKRCDRAWKAHPSGIIDAAVFLVPPFDKVAKSVSGGREDRCCENGGCQIM